MDLAECADQFRDERLDAICRELLRLRFVRANDRFVVTYQSDGSVVIRPVRDQLTPGRDYQHLPCSNEWSADDEA